MTSAHPFTLAEFGQLVSAALESEELLAIVRDPEIPSSCHSFLSFSTPKSRRPGTTSPTACQSLSPPLKSFFSFPKKPRMLHHPQPMRPIDAMSQFDLTQTCMPVYPPCRGTPTPASRPRARQVLDKIKRQASALVKSPTMRLRSRSCTPPDAPEQTPHVPTSRGPSCSYDDDDDACSTNASILHIDAPAAGDFVPYLPLATRMERQSASYATDALASNPRPHPSSASTPPPLLGRPVLPPPSPSPSERSDSTTSSTRSPVTPVFSSFSSYYDVHPYASPAAVSQRWSLGSDEQEQISDPFAKGKVQIVRRSLIQDNFLLACAAVDDSQTSPSAEDNNVCRSPKGKRSAVFKKKSTTFLPPSKPPPSCPLPSPPPTSLSEGYDFIQSLPDTPNTPPVVDEEWTLFLGAPSTSLGLPLLVEPNETGRGRSGSLPAPPSPPSKQHLSPTDIPLRIQQERHQPRQRTISNMSTRSNATTRRIESGPAPDFGSPSGAEGCVDWTLSLPVLRKPKSSSDTSKLLEPPPEARTRRCRSFIDWTTSLSDRFEKEQARLREVERERQRERKTSRVSAVSAASAKDSQHSAPVKRLPIGPSPTSSPPQQALPALPLAHTNGSTSSLNRAATKSRTSLRSCASSSSSSYSSSASYKDILPFDPCAPGVAPVSPITPTFSTYADSILTIPAPRSPSIATFSTLANFPLPPSFSSKLLQRRSAAPPLPKPLLPTGKYNSYKASPLSCSGVYVEPARASTSTALPSILSLSAADLDAHVACSAPATSLNFPSSVFASGTLKRTSGSLRRASETLRRTSGSLRRKESSVSVSPTRRDSLNERPDSYYYRPTTSSSTTSTTSTTSSTSTVSAASSKSSVRSASSASTVVPTGKTSRLVARLGEPSGSQEEERGQVVDFASPVRRSFDSSARASEYDTCNEDGFSDEEISSPRSWRRSEDETRSECFYSARSSLDL